MRQHSRARCTRLAVCLNFYKMIKENRTTAKVRANPAVEEVDEFIYHDGSGAHISISSETAVYDTMAILSFVFSLLGICVCLCAGWFSLPIPFASFVFYYWGRKSGQYHNLATIGAIISAVTLTTIVLLTIIGLCFYLSLAAINVVGSTIN